MPVSDCMSKDNIIKIQKKGGEYIWMKPPICIE